MRDKDNSRSSSSSPPLAHAGLEAIQVTGGHRNHSSPSLRHAAVAGQLALPASPSDGSLSDHVNQSLADNAFSALPFLSPLLPSASTASAAAAAASAPATATLPPLAESVTLVPLSAPDITATATTAASAIDGDADGSAGQTPDSTQSAPSWSAAWRLNIEAVERYIRQGGDDFDSDSDREAEPLIEPLSAQSRLLSLNSPLSLQQQQQSLPRPPPFSSHSYSSHYGQPKYNPDMRFTFYSESKHLLQANHFSSLSPDLALLMKKECFWLDINRPDDQDMRMIAKVFNIHPLTIEDIASLDPREKCELFDSYLFICIRSTDQSVTSSEFLQPFNLYLIVFPNCLLSISESPLAASVQTYHVLSRLGRSPDLRLSADWLLYALLDDIVDGFMPNIKTMEMEVDSIDDLVLILSESDQRDMLRRIGKARKRVTAMLRLLSPKIEVIKGLVKRAGASGRLAPNTIVYLRDVQDHLITMSQSLEHFGETLNRSHSNYLAQISIELTQASNRMNSVVKSLSVCAAIFLPLTLYAGIWGMNVPVPGEPDVGLAQLGPFFAILASMVLLVIIFCIIARKIN